MDKYEQNRINLTPHIRCAATHVHTSHFYQADSEGSNRSAARFYCVETAASRKQRRRNAEVGPRRLLTEYHDSPPANRKDRN